jgi:hypothetical protein
MNWEEIGDGEFRAKVPRGWLVKICADVHEIGTQPDGYMACHGSGWNYRVALAFVPDPKHEWKI